MKLERLGSGWIRGVVAPSPTANNEVGIRGVGVEGNEMEAGSGVIGELTEAEIEERELVEWASLKECQVKFMRENGVGAAGLM